MSASFGLGDRTGVSINTLALLYWLTVELQGNSCMIDSRLFIKREICLRAVRFNDFGQDLQVVLANDN